MFDKSVHWQSALDDLSEGFAQSTVGIRKALLSVATHAAHEMGAAESSVLVPNNRRQGLRFLVSFSPHATDLEQLRVPIDSSLAGRVYATGQLLATEDEPPAVPIPGEPPKVYLAFPLDWDDRTLGVATYVNRQGEPPFERFEKRDFEIASRYAVLQASLLRQFLRMQTLTEIALSDLAPVLQEVAGEELPAALSSARELDLGDESWRATANQLSGLSDNEQLLCSRFVKLVGQWVNGTLE